MATGKLQHNPKMERPTDPYTFIGCEFAGIQNGKRVAGLSTQGCFSLQCISNMNLCWEIPDHWSLEDAATTPMAYATVSSNKISKNV